MEAYKQLLGELRFNYFHIAELLLFLVSDNYSKEEFRKKIEKADSNINGLNTFKFEIADELFVTYVEDIEKYDRLLNGYSDILEHSFLLTFKSLRKSPEFQTLKTNKEQRVLKGLSYRKNLNESLKNGDAIRSIIHLCERYVYLLSDIVEMIKNQDPFIKRIEVSNRDRFSTDTEKILTAHLGCLNGCYKGKKIMSEIEYENLIDYATQTVINRDVPQKVIYIKTGNSGISKMFIQHTIYRLWKYLKAEQGDEQKVWVRFLQTVFKDYFKGNTEDYLLKKFNKYVNNYDQDRAAITYHEKK